MSTMQVRDVHFPKERTSRRRRHFCFVTFESMQARPNSVLPQNPQTYYGSMALIASGASFQYNDLAEI